MPGPFVGRTLLPEAGTLEFKMGQLGTNRFAGQSLALAIPVSGPPRGLQPFEWVACCFDREPGWRLRGAWPPAASPLRRPLSELAGGRWGDVMVPVAA